MRRILLILWAVCFAIWIGLTARFFMPAFFPDEHQRLAREAVPADCRLLKSARECAERLTALGLNPFSAYGYADVEPLYHEIERPTPPYLKIAVISLVPPLGVLGLGAGLIWIVGRIRRPRADDALAAS